MALTDVPFAGVLFDFHSTLIDQGPARERLDLAWKRTGRVPDPVEALGAEQVDELTGVLDRIWEHAREIDPGNERDLDLQRHREVFHRLATRLRTRLPALDDELTGALHATLTDTWTPYQDSAPTLHALRGRGLRIAVLSNAGIDIRPVLVRGGLADLVDAVVVSFEVGLVKPDAAVFRLALDLIGVPAEQALMVGDSWQDDAAAAALGIRTLLLPRTSGPVHGLDTVLRLVG